MLVVNLSVDQCGLYIFSIGVSNELGGRGMKFSGIIFVISGEAGAFLRVFFFFFFGGGVDLVSQAILEGGQTTPTPL